MVSGLGSFGAPGLGDWRPVEVTEHAREQGEALSRGGYVRPRAIESVERPRRGDVDVFERDDRSERSREVAETYRPRRRRLPTDESRRTASPPDEDIPARSAEAEVPTRREATQPRVSRESPPRDKPPPEEDPAGDGLTEDERQVVTELQSRDREVRAHENAHASAGGAYAGAPSYSYQTGPDGKRYAVGGEVQIDAAPVQGNPEATVEKMRTVIRASLAPAEPSSQDQRVAASATQVLLDAQAEIAEERSEIARASTQSTDAEERPAAPADSTSTGDDSDTRGAASEREASAAARRKTANGVHRTRDSGRRARGQARPPAAIVGPGGDPLSVVVAGDGKAERVVWAQRLRVGVGFASMPTLRLLHDKVAPADGRRSGLKAALRRATIYADCHAGHASWAGLAAAAVQRTDRVGR